ncbi:hypoxia inducible factor 1 subunit alpha, like 2 isoform X2 [Engraulis encrasicolus]|uniref:hypoxia inducible factor 1 subunit alpha, like 2 isoform X2 n=1 Tax=Engraulis encrasicolus TaxID=184585 RepID=UPI002FD26FAE
MNLLRCSFATVGFFQRFQFHCLSTGQSSCSIYSQSVALKRARSRVTARVRRQRERQLFKELTDLLPLPHRRTGPHLNKASIIRLTVGYLHVRALLDSTCLKKTETTTKSLDAERPSFGSIYPPAMTATAAGCVEEGLLDLGLGRFLLAIFFNGQVIFTTENVNKYIGINQMDLIGRSLFDIMHPYDQKEVKQVLTNLAGNAGPQKCRIFWRTRTSPNLRPMRVLHCSGVKSPLVSLATHCLLLLCRPLPVHAGEGIPSGLSQRSFLSIHSPDLTFTYCDSSVWELTGFQDDELFGQSVYKYYHASDYLKLVQAHFCLLSKGQMTTGKYRFLVKHGGYAWAETEASVVYDAHTRQPQKIICINYLLSDVEQADVVFSQEQLDDSLGPCGLCPETVPSPPPPPPPPPQLTDRAAGHNTQTQASALPLLCNTSGHNWGPGSSATLHRHICEKTSISYDMWDGDGDLDALAPYIAMDEEDAVLLPRVSYSRRERQQSSQARSLSGNILDAHHERGGKPQHASECVLCSADPMAIDRMCQTQPQPNHTSRTQTHRLAQSGHAPKQRTSGDPWLAWSALRAIVEQDYSTPQTHTPLYPQPDQTVKKTPMQSSWHTPIPRNRQAPVSHQHPYPTWQRDKGIWVGNQDSSFLPSSLQWTGQPHPGHTKGQLQNPGRPRSGDKGHGDSVGMFPASLPVLSHRECEVNAPLGPTCYLLKGAEITSVLDQAATRISVGL